MKKTTILLALFLLCGLGYAQHTNSSEQTTAKREKLSKEEKKNLLTEKRQSRQPSNSQKTTLAVPNQFTKMIYVTSLWGDNPGFFETTLGGFSCGVKLNSIDLSIQAMERTCNGDIYVVAWDSDAGGWFGEVHFGKIDRAGNLTLIAEDVDFDAASMAWNPITETMYVVDVWGDFGTVNLTTGEFTSIAIPDWWYTIAIDNNGICYAIEWGYGEFGTFDLATGAFTMITDEFPLDVFDFQGMKFDRKTNELYWQAHIDATGAPETDFYKINPITGELTLLGEVAERFFDFVILDTDPFVVTLLDSISTLLDNIEQLEENIRELARLLDECENGESSIDLIIPQQQIQIFPNPVSYELRIINYEWQQGDIVELFDMNGKRMYSARGNGDTFTIDMSAYPQGNYILRIGNRVAKVVKQ
ncbi:MAG: T9SS type A sorting domain-containing protein [Bacteroidales bacterium]|jgi:hypothetical protein|nr:T9SS type A sorting domain-containing protein [Bacteroidales bacterium]